MGPGLTSAYSQWRFGRFRITPCPQSLPEASVQTVRRFSIVMFAAFCALTITMALFGTSASAEPSAHPSQCSDFNSQADAQIYFDIQGEDYLNLDSDGNGIPCDQPG